MYFKDTNNTFRDYSLFLFQFKLVVYVVFFRIVRKVFGAVGIVPEIDIIRSVAGKVYRTLVVGVDVERI